MNTLLVSLVGLTESWIREQRELYFPRCRQFSQAERFALAGHVDESLLQRARIAMVSEVENPPFVAQAIAALRGYGIEADFDFTLSAGITFDDCIVVRDGALNPRLLLHELVHVAQYRRLSVAGFARGYVWGLAAAGFVYEKNPFEEIAFRLDAQFASGRSLDLSAEVDRWVEQQGNSLSAT